MSSELHFFAKLLVLDPKASAEFYEALGFTRVGADGTFIHLRWETHGDVMLVGAPTGVRVDAASMTPEALAERWSAVNDLTGAMAYGNAMDAVSAALKGA